MVLRRYYELLTDAIFAYRMNGIHYIVGALAIKAGKVLGEEAVAASTVRLWHVEYVERKGEFRPDERGHYTRELLVMEEDVKSKFVKWSLGKAKADELSVEAAQEFLSTRTFSLHLRCDRFQHQWVHHCLTICLACASPCRPVHLPNTKLSCP